MLLKPVSYHIQLEFKAFRVWLKLTISNSLLSQRIPLLNGSQIQYSSCWRTIPNSGGLMKSLTQILQICIVFTGLIALTLAVSASSAVQAPYQAKVLAEIEELKQKLANNGDDPFINYQIGELYSRIGRSQESIAAFEQAVQIKPDFASGHYRLGWIYGSSGKFDKALEAHQQALAYAETESFKMKVSKAEAQFAVGWDLYHLKRYDEAIAAYQATLQFDSGYEDAL